MEDCVWCQRAAAVVGLMAGVGIAYIAIDTLTGGWLTRSLTGGARQLATVTELRPDAGEGA